MSKRDDLNDGMEGVKIGHINWRECYVTQTLELPFNSTPGIVSPEA
jgi:hypothetical protein